MCKLLSNQGIETEAVIDTDAVYKIEEISCIYLQVKWHLYYVK